MSDQSDKLLDQFLRELVAETPEAADELTTLVDELPTEIPSAAARNSLFAGLTTSRFERFSKIVAGLLDIDQKTANGLLDGIDLAESWEAGLMPGMELYHVEGGPAVVRAITGFIRLRSGQQCGGQVRRRSLVD